MSLNELAEHLRPRRLVGQYEYQLAEPDFEVAAKILAMTSVPETHGKPPMTVEDGTKPQFIIGGDDRTHTPNAAAWPGSTFAFLPQQCTATMIGPSTALCAAHCFYQFGSWISTPYMAFGANNFGTWGTLTQPFGTFVFDSITMPGGWTGNWDWPSLDWDFAVLEFSPTRFPGWSTGWMGTQYNYNGAQHMRGYPSDKWYQSQWVKDGWYYSSNGAARYVHNLDVFGGDSGACTYNDSNYCTGIQSTQWNESYWPYLWNEVRRWDGTTHSFFDTYGNWP